MKVAIGLAMESRNADNMAIKGSEFVILLLPLLMNVSFCSEMYINFIIFSVNYIFQAPHRS